MNNRAKYGPTLLERFYASLADNPDSTTQEIAQRCGMTVIRASRCITKLVERGQAGATGKRPCRQTKRWTTAWRVRK